MKTQPGTDAASNITGKVPFRLGLLVDSLEVSKYVYDIARWAYDHRDINFKICVIVHSSGCAKPRPHFIRRIVELLWSRRLLSAALWKLIVLLEFVLLKRNPNYADHFTTYSLRQWATEAMELHPIVSRTDFVYRFSRADIEAVSSLNCDLLVRCGGAILRGEILQAARWGIISFHHADNRVIRGIPAGFWEVYGRLDTTGFTIQLLTEELDGGNVLMRGHFATRHYYLLNQASLYSKSNRYLKLIIEKIALKGSLPPILPNLPYSHVLFRSPGARHSAKYLIKFFSLLIKKQVRKLLGIGSVWNVAYTYRNWRNVVLWRATWLAITPGHFLADPFVLTKDAKDYLFVEDYDFKKSRGTIAVYALSATGASRIGTALEESFHLSFPYVFEYANQVYMCPETSQNRDIRIYRSIEFPLKWKLEKVLLRDLSAVDTLIFKENERWWLFTNVDSGEEGDYCSELHIFSSETLLGDR